MDARQRGHLVGCCRGCCRCTAFVISFLLYVCVATLFNLASVWNWTYEPMGFQCKHPPLPVNNSGVKVLIFAPEKSGTSTMVRFLRKIYPRAWHSEDILTHIWAPISDAFWHRPENGGGIFPWQRLATPRFPAYKGFSFMLKSEGEDAADTRVLMGLGAELQPLLANRLSRCRADTLTFDHLAELFWPIYDVSPDAKVVMLNWRTFEEWRRSGLNFGLSTVLTLLFVNLVNVGQHLLPWNALILPLWDALTGNELLEHMRDGTPVAEKGSLRKLLFVSSMTERRIIQHWNSGFSDVIPWNAPDRASSTNFTRKYIETEDDFRDLWNVPRRHIPKERLLEFDVQKDSPMALCRFLGKEDNPACNIRLLPKNRPSMLSSDPDHPEFFFYLWPLYLAIHSVNFKLIRMLICWLARALLRVGGVLHMASAKQKKG